jgi:MFS family permease
VLDRIRDPNIWRIYVATLLLGGAYGMAISLTAIYLDDAGFSKRDIGTLAAWFAGGIVALSLPAGAFVRRFGAKTTLVVALVGYGVTVGVFPFLRSYASVAAVRFVDGACSVSLWVSMETILLARAEREHKAFVTSLYAIAMSVGYVVGPLGARALAGVGPLATGFVAAAVMAGATAAYVAARLDADGPAASSGAEREALGPRASLASILWRIKTSCFGAYAYGYFQSSVVLFLPLYLMAQKGIAREQTILVPAFFAAGMLLFANIAGRLGDRHGHLALMRLLAIVGGAMIFSFVFLDTFPMMCAAVFVAGATLASISPVSLALQGLVVDESDYSRATALYNAFYASGMLLGPPISSVLFERWGGAAMLYHLAALWAAFIAFSVVFRRDDPAAYRHTPALVAAKP